MLNGVRDQFVHDECERNCQVSGDGKRIGIDDSRQTMMSAHADKIVTKPIMDVLFNTRASWKKGL